MKITLITALTALSVTAGAQQTTNHNTLPFQPEEFTPAKEWQGKTVLAELFTGSECPPCVAADLGFDGLIESYDGKYLAVLVYHLPIPRPDPMMNPATEMRQNYYGRQVVRGTPTTIFDGQPAHGGGGGESRAQLKYEQYASAVNERIYGKPEATLSVSASLRNNTVTVTWSADKKLPNADYNIALVQKKEQYVGGNGLPVHSMVVRENRP